ncbi:MAG: ATP-binding protein [Endomicrobiaceae bacterium]
MEKKLSFSLSFKFVIIISVVIIFTSLVLTWFFINGQTLLLRGFVENRAIILAHTLANSSEYGVTTVSKEFLSHLTKNTIKEEDVLYSIIYDKNGIPLSESSISDHLIDQYITSTPIEPSSISALEKTRLQKGVSVISGIGEVIEIIVPIISYDYMNTANSLSYQNSFSAPDNGVIIGVVRVGLTLERINYQIDKMSKSIVFLTLIVVLAGIIIAIFLIKILVKPIQELIIGTKKIAMGNLGYRVPLNSRDEFRDLAISFNSMATEMEVHIRELNKEKKELLNLKIAFEQRSQELEETLDKVQNIQQDLIKSEKFATIGRLASSVAHELRNPLAGIKNIAYFLAKMGAFSDDKSKQMVNMLSSEVQRANKIITDLLDYSKTKKLNKLEVKIDSFIEKALLNVTLPEQVNILKDFESFTAIIDPDKITQVIINLVSNARDAMPPEGGTITIIAKKEYKSFILIIEDNACGMDTETQSHLFEPLFTTKLKGIGLGLPIVKEIIEAHLGKISVKSKKNIGTTFTIELPLS